MLVLGLTAAAAVPALAQSSSSVTMNGFTVTVHGGSSNSISAIPGGAHVAVDGNDIRIETGRITVNGAVLLPGNFTAVSIDAGNYALRISADGTSVYTISEFDGLKSAAERGDAEALNRLGDLYYDGNGVERDYTRALGYYEQALAAGNQAAGGSLATIYWWGDGVKPDPEKAVGYAKPASEAGSSQAKYILGLAYEAGKGVDRDIDRAVGLFLTAGDAGNTSALNHLGNLLSQGDLVPQDLPKSAEFYKRAADLGSNAGQSNYAWVLWKGKGVAKNPREALRYGQMSADQGSPAGLFFVGYANYAGAEGVPKDHVRAAEMFRAAADKGHATAAYNLALMYRDGEGLPHDIDAAIHWMTKARDWGDTDAGKALAELQQAKNVGTAGPGTDAGRGSDGDASPATPNAGDAVYWYALGQRQVGPVSLSELRRALATGTIGPDTLVWKNGLPGWVAVRSFDDLTH